MPEVIHPRLDSRPLVFQSVNPVFIILLAPVFATMWIKLDKADCNPSIPRKLAYGMAGAAIGFLRAGVRHPKLVDLQAARFSLSGPWP